MSGPCKYHSHGNYKASYSTRDCSLDDKLAKEKNGRTNDDTDGEDDGSPPPLTSGSGTQGHGTGGSGGDQITFLKDVRQVNMIFGGSSLGTLRSRH